jgi:hypothetical protein
MGFSVQPSKLICRPVKDHVKLVLAKTETPYDECEILIGLRAQLGFADLFAELGLEDYDRRIVVVAPNDSIDPAVVRTISELPGHVAELCLDVPGDKALIQATFEALISPMSEFFKELRN